MAKPSYSRTSKLFKKVEWEVSHFLKTKTLQFHTSEGGPTDNQLNYISNMGTWNFKGYLRSGYIHKSKMEAPFPVSVFFISKTWFASASILYFTSFTIISSFVSPNFRRSRFNLGLRFRNRRCWYGDCLVFWLWPRYLIYYCTQHMVQVFNFGF